MSNIPNRIVTLKINDSCPLRCRHCSLGYGIQPPTGLAAWTPEQLDEVMRGIDAIVYDGVSFAGGEPSLSPHLLRTGIQIAGERNLLTGMVTAPIWAKTLDRACRFLDELPFDFIVLSYDKYHLEFLSPDHYENAIRAAQENGASVSMNCCYATEEDRQQLTEATSHFRSRAKYGLYFVFSQVLPVGDAHTLAGRDSITVVDSETLRALPRSCVAGKLPLVSDASAVRACCWASTVKDSPIQFGLQGPGGVAAGFAAMKADRTLAKLQQRGLIDSLSYEAQTRLAEAVKGRRYVNECDLCVEMMAVENRDLWDSSIHSRASEDTGVGIVAEQLAK